MSLRLEMMQVARLAPQALGESTSLVLEFLRREQNPDGGFKDRSGKSDLYYTVFAVDSLIALRAEVDRDTLRRHLESFGDGSALDFVHLCCLARAWASLNRELREPAAPLPLRQAILRHILSFETSNGGFHPARGETFGTAYGAFLALGASQDLGIPLPDPTRLASSLAELRTADGAWTNELRAGVPMTIGSTNATAAAVAVLRNLGTPTPSGVSRWLLASAHPGGGFLAMPRAPIPDLLSTATALHALAGLGAPLRPVQEACLDFIDTLWTNAGSFHGNWTEETLDSEYTFYGLLALGHLSATR
ncbi:MAG TPA: hypothetical protein DCM86_16545 [Verrucomicrobiales bacterium]|nr:hypothetical protein [Verrucomicrobiales bacterium]